jgi:hypothetical protein
VQRYGTRILPELGALSCTHSMSHLLLGLQLAYIHVYQYHASRCISNVAAFTNHRPPFFGVTTLQVHNTLLLTGSLRGLGSDRRTRKRTGDCQQLHWHRKVPAASVSIL